NGDDEIVAIIKNDEVNIKLKYLKDYLTARKKYCLIFFDFIRLTNIEQVSSCIKPYDKVINTDKFIYKHSIYEYLGDKEQFCSAIIGKSLIKFNADYIPHLYDPFEEDTKYEKFIIGY